MDHDDDDNKGKREKEKEREHEVVFFFLVFRVVDIIPASIELKSPAPASIGKGGQPP